MLWCHCTGTSSGSRVVLLTSGKQIKKKNPLSLFNSLPFTLFIAFITLKMLLWRFIICHQVRRCFFSFLCFWGWRVHLYTMFINELHHRTEKQNSCWSLGRCCCHSWLIYNLSLSSLSYYLFHDVPKALIWWRVWTAHRPVQHPDPWTMNLMQKMV